MQTLSCSFYPCVADTADHSGMEYFDEICNEGLLIARDITVTLLKETENRGKANDPFQQYPFILLN